MKTPVLSSAEARSSTRLTIAFETYSPSSAPFGERSTISSTRGCSGASTKKVAPNTVSGRVVKTGTSSSSSAIRNSSSAPSERPIQLRWIVFVRSGQSISAWSRSSASAYAVMRKNHCCSFRISTSAPQRSQCPFTTCSFASTVWSCGHQLTAASLR